MSYLIAHKGTGEIIKRGLTLDETASVLGKKNVQALDHVERNRFSHGWLYARDEDRFDPNEKIRSLFPIVVVDTWNYAIVAFPCVAKVTADLGFSRNRLVQAERRGGLIDDRYRVYFLRQVGMLTRLNKLGIKYMEVQL